MEHTPKTTSDPQRLLTLAVRFRRLNIALLLLLLGHIGGFMLLAATPDDAGSASLLPLVAALVYLATAINALVMIVLTMQAATDNPAFAVLSGIAALVPLLALLVLLSANTYAVARLTTGGLRPGFMGLPRNQIEQLRNLVEGRESSLELSGSRMILDRPALTDEARLDRVRRWRTVLLWSLLATGLLWAMIIAGNQGEKESWAQWLSKAALMGAIGVGLARVFIVPSLLIAAKRGLVEVIGCALAQLLPVLGVVVALAVAASIGKQLTEAADAGPGV